MSKKNYFIDRNGNPYTRHSMPAGGGLDKRCDFNKDALHAYYNVPSSSDDYLEGNGFTLVHSAYPHAEVWEKGNTRIVFESYIDGLWGYVHTEFIG